MHVQYGMKRLQGTKKELFRVHDAEVCSYVLYGASYSVYQKSGVSKKELNGILKVEKGSEKSIKLVQRCHNTRKYLGHQYP